MYVRDYHLNYLNLLNVIMEWKMTYKSVTKRPFMAHTNNYFDSLKARTDLKKANKGRFHSFEDYCNEIKAFII